MYVPCGAMPPAIRSGQNMEPQVSTLHCTEHVLWSHFRGQMDELITVYLSHGVPEQKKSSLNVFLIQC